MHIHIYIYICICIHIHIYIYIYIYLWALPSTFPVLLPFGNLTFCMSLSRPDNASVVDDDMYPGRVISFRFVVSVLWVSLVGRFLLHTVVLFLACLPLLALCKYSLLKFLCQLEPFCIAKGNVSVCVCVRLHVITCVYVAPRLHVLTCAHKIIE